MTTLREAAEKALKALEVATTPRSEDRQTVLKAQAALREALAHREIESAKRELLRHQAAADYHARMSEYCIAAIRRLNSFIREEQK